MCQEAGGTASWQIFSWSFDKVKKQKKCCDKVIRNFEECSQKLFQKWICKIILIKISEISIQNIQILIKFDENLKTPASFHEFRRNCDARDDAKVLTIRNTLECSRDNLIRLENAATWPFSCKNRRRYSRERASERLKTGTVAKTAMVAGCGADPAATPHFKAFAFLKWARSVADEHRCGASSHDHREVRLKRGVARDRPESPFQTCATSAGEYPSDVQHRSFF
jgi:hypothetical protein